MLHDAPYHQAKAGIMQPLFEFNELMNQRTLTAVQAAERHALRLRGIFIFFALSALLMLWRTYRVLRETLGGAVDDVHARIVRLGQGDFSSTTPVAPAGTTAWSAGWRRRNAA